MKHLYIILFVFAISLTTQASESPWLICQTNDFQPDVDFLTSDSSILLKLTRADEKISTYKVNLDLETITYIRASRTFDSLVFVAADANSASKAAVVTMDRGLTSIAVDGNVYSDLNCR
jgi:hypothetical protein